jgi:hypothetical protein
MEWHKLWQLIEMKVKSAAMQGDGNLGGLESLPPSQTFRELNSTKE